LLFAISAQRELSWQAFATALDAIFVPDEQVASDVTHIRSTVAALGDSLGHWEVVPDGSSARIYVAPPALARLPQPGRPTAVLCGSRTPDTLPAASAACQGSRVEMRAIRQTHMHPYAPSRVEFSADSVEEIGRAASALHVAFTPTPPAWSLALACGSMTEYLASLQWSSNPDLNWLRRDFDSAHLRFRRASGDSVRSGLSLTAYSHPSGWARQDRLWRGTENALADRNWGRYAVLSDRDIRILRFDHGAGNVAVPRQVPLPKIAARSLGLCTGRPPAIEPGEGLGSNVYSGVPVSIFEALAAKLGQHDPCSNEEIAEVSPL
jgi:hypothetical protein